jgi:hypothetical protein
MEQIHASEGEEEDGQEEEGSASESDYDSDSSAAAVRPTEKSWVGCREGIGDRAEKPVPGCWVLGAWQGGPNAPQVCDVHAVALNGKLGFAVRAGEKDIDRDRSQSRAEKGSDWGREGGIRSERGVR